MRSIVSEAGQTEARLTYILVSISFVTAGSRFGDETIPFIPAGPGEPLPVARGNRVSLTPKAFDVLRYLVENPGRVVTQGEILESVWPDTYVNPELIKKYILGIRKVLRRRTDKPVFIETFPKRGYQFVAPVSDETAAATAELPSDSRKMVGGIWPSAELQRSLDQSATGPPAADVRHG